MTELALHPRNALSPSAVRSVSSAVGAALKLLPLTLPRKSSVHPSLGAHSSFERPHGRDLGVLSSPFY